MGWRNTLSAARWSRPVATAAPPSHWASPDLGLHSVSQLGLAVFLGFPGMSAGTLQAVGTTYTAAPMALPQVVSRTYRSMALDLHLGPR